MRQVIAFNRGKVFTEGKSNSAIDVERVKKLQTLIYEFGRFGYTFSKDVLEKITVEEMEEFYNQVLPILVKKFHDDFGTDFKPLWPGFPAQTKDIDGDVLAIQEKIYEGTVDYDDPMFTYDGELEKEVVKDPVVLGIMTPEEFDKIPETICSSGFALADQTEKELIWFLQNKPDCKLPQTIPFKETLVKVMDYRPDYVPGEFTDILRLALFKMTGTTEILKKSGEKVKSLSRKDRKLILGLIEKLARKKPVENWVEDALRHLGHWILVIKHLHISDYSKRYPVALSFCDLVCSRNHGKTVARTWASQLQSLYQNGTDIEEISEFISQRPGEMLRRLDSLLRRYVKDGKNVNSLLMKVFNIGRTKCKNKTLLEILDYYRRRNEGRSRIIKFSDKRGVRINKEISPLPALPEDVLEATISVLRNSFYQKIRDRFNGTEMTGQVVVLDPNLKDIPAPIDMRGDSSIPRGTIFNIPENVDIIRFFCHWVDETGNEDLDLHGFFLTENMKSYIKIGWDSELKNKLGGHSGDVCHRKGKCSEYVDINIPGVLKEGYRYALISVNNYEGRGFNTLPCWIGYEYYLTEMCGNVKKWNPKDPQFMTPIDNIPSSSYQAWLFDIKERKAMLVNLSVGIVSTIPDAGVCSNVVSYIKGCTDIINTYDILDRYYTSQGAKVVSTADFKEEDVEENTVISYITKDEILKDYTKITQAIGE